MAIPRFSVFTLFLFLQLAIPRYLFLLPTLFFHLSKVVFPDSSSRYLCAAKRKKRFTLLRKANHFLENTSIYTGKYACLYLV